MIRHKYHNKPTALDGLKFDSKAEARRYGQLKLLQASGEVVVFLRQVPFYLPGNVRYVCDFQIFWADGHVSFEDVKSPGTVTKLYLAKKKLVEHHFAPIVIEEVY